MYYIGGDDVQQQKQQHTCVLLKYIEFCLEILARPKMESQNFFTNFSNFQNNKP